MSSLRIAVCDDEKLVRDDLARLVEKALPSSEIKVLSSGDALLSDAGSYDIVLLDIEMPGENGMETAKEIRRRSRETVIIFITGYEAYMQDAFDVQAFHYLLKPVREEKLCEVLSRAKNEIERVRSDTERYILLKSSGMSRKILLDDIIFLESNNKKVIVHLSDGAVLESYKKMDDMEQVLGSAFFRCHRGYIINLKHIVSYTASEVTLAGGTRILIAQRKYTDFVKVYLRYAKTGGTYVDY